MTDAERQLTERLTAISNGIAIVIQLAAASAATLTALGVQLGQLQKLLAPPPAPAVEAQPAPEPEAAPTRTN